VQVLGIKGRALLVGLTQKSFEIAPYAEVLNKEAEIIGVSDHLAQEIPLLIEWVRQGKLKLSSFITETVPLDAAAINQALDRLEQFGDAVRVVIKP
jgi:propanol-preferring alcohol dehydrogenase